jgi:cysteine desulfurase
VGRLPIDVLNLDVDLLTLSGHKFGGPAGIGALYVRRGVPLAGYPYGDDRERHRRAGMENLPGAVGMAVALDAARDELGDQAAGQWALTTHIRNTLVDQVPSCSVHGHPTQRAPHLVCFSVSGVDPEVLLMALDDRGFRVGGGGVASGLAHAPSPVLEAMGVQHAYSFRVGVGRLTTKEDADRFLGALPPLISELQRMEEASSHTLDRIRGNEN